MAGRAKCTITGGQVQVLLKEHVERFTDDYLNEDEEYIVKCYNSFWLLLQKVCYCEEEVDRAGCTGGLWGDLLASSSVWRRDMLCACFLLPEEQKDYIRQNIRQTPE